MKKGGEFRNLEDVLRKLSVDSPNFVKVNRIKVGGLKAHEDGRIEVTARRCLSQGGAGVWGLKALRGVAIESVTKSYFRQDDHEDVYYHLYFLKDYRINPNAPALPPEAPKGDEAPKAEAPKKSDELKVLEMLGKPDFEKGLEALLAYVDGLFKKSKVHGYLRMKTVRGKRYVQVLSTEKRSGGESNGHIWCFIDQNGDILKPASWRAPAKHARGSIYDPNSWGQFSWTGPQYLRG